MDEALRLERVIDLPRAIVWDALVDPVLVEGWLHPTARLVAADDVSEGADDAPRTLERREPALLRVLSPEFGDVSIALDVVEGGTRGTSTGLRLDLAGPVDPRFRAPLIACWQTRLDQLENVLRGHPVDWQNWERDHGAGYEEYLQQAAAQ